MSRRNGRFLTETKRESLRDQSFAADKRNLAIADLLARARALVKESISFHIASVNIGKLEHLSETGIIKREMEEVRDYIERADKLQADIDRLTTNEATTDVCKNCGQEVLTIGGIYRSHMTPHYTKEGKPTFYCEKKKRE